MMKELQTIGAAKVSRRRLLRWGAEALLAAGLWPGTLAASGEGNSGDFQFIMVNDTHYIDQGCGSWIAKVIKQMKNHGDKLAFCLHGGDLSHEGKPLQLAATRDAFKVFGSPTYFVIGNHDYLTQQDRKAYENLFPGPLNYYFSYMGWQFVALDTTEGQHTRNTMVQAPTLRWLDDNVPKLDKKKPLIILTHFPLGPWVIGRPNNANAVLERFKEYNLQAVLSGHFHSYTVRKVGQIVLTTDRCCSYRRPNHDGTKQKGYFLCHAKDGRVRHEFVEAKVS
jgi:predicted phosphodiesterase